MWRTYRKRFLFNQILILMICAILRWAVGTPWRNLGIYLVVMELGGVAGAWWAARIAGRVEQQDRGPFIRR